MKIRLLIAAALTLTPAAMSLANTPAVAKRVDAVESRPVTPVANPAPATIIDSTYTQGCTTGVRVAYTGYGEATRTCAARQSRQGAAETLPAVR